MRKRKLNSREIKLRNENRFRVWLWLILIAFGIWALLLVINLIKIQIFDPGKYRILGKDQHAANYVSLRGNIYDRNGIKLATDETYFEVYVHKKTEDKKSSEKKYDNGYKHSQKELAETLSPILNMSQSQILSILKKAPIGSYPIKKHISRETKDKIVALGWISDLSVGEKPTRVYPQGTLAAHVLGYHNTAALISTGVEATAENKLRYSKKLIPIEKVGGKIVFGITTDPIAVTSLPKGDDITLTIDARIQHIAEKELYKQAIATKADGGFAVVMNPRNGEILAYAVYPYFDPNKHGQGTPKQLKNWSLTDIYPPGSTFKIITVASALELGKITENEKVYDACKIMVGGFPITNSHCYPSGMITLAQLFERSSNIAAYNVAKLMSNKEFYDQIRRFGFGDVTGIDLPAESAGLMPHPKTWSGSTKATISYGYGSVTAMQMVAAIAALANDGIKITPHVIKYSPEEAANKVFSTQVVSPETARAVTRQLVQGVDMGQTTFKLEKYQLAAKTGTSKKLLPNGKYSDSMSYTSTIGYFPASDPQVLVYVCFDSPKTGNAFGNTIAGPVLKNIAEQTAIILNLKSDKVSK